MQVESLQKKLMEAQAVPSGMVRSPDRFLFSMCFQVGFGHVWVIDVVVPTSAGGQPGSHGLADREALTAIMSSYQRILSIYRIYMDL